MKLRFRRFLPFGQLYVPAYDVHALLLWIAAGDNPKGDARAAARKIGALH